MPMPDLMAEKLRPPRILLLKMWAAIRTVIKNASSVPSPRAFTNSPSLQ